MRTTLTIIGTRPEAIKLAPVIKAIDNQKYFNNKVCLTRQHTGLLDPFLADLTISVDYELQELETQGSLHLSAAHILKQFNKILAKLKPDLGERSLNCVNRHITFQILFYLENKYLAGKLPMPNLELADSI